MSCKRSATGMRNIGDTAARGGTKQSHMPPDRKDAARSCISYYQLHAVGELSRFFVTASCDGIGSAFQALD